MDGVFTRRSGAQPNRAGPHAMDRHDFGGADKQGHSCPSHSIAQPSDLGPAFRKYPLHVRGCVESLDPVRVAVWRLKSILPTTSGQGLPVHGVKNAINERD